MRSEAIYREECSEAGGTKRVKIVDEQHGKTSE